MQFHTRVVVDLHRVPFDRAHRPPSIPLVRTARKAAGILAGSHRRQLEEDSRDQMSCKSLDMRRLDRRCCTDHADRALVVAEEDANWPGNR